MDRQKTIRFLRQVCLQYEVKVVFKSNLDRDLDGEADVEKEIIYIDKKLPRKALAEAVFHELGHIYCYRKKKSGKNFMKDMTILQSSHLKPKTG